jgi:hypothetical protein
MTLRLTNHIPMTINSDTNRAAKLIAIFFEVMNVFEVNLPLVEIKFRKIVQFTPGMIIIHFRLF